MTDYDLMQKLKESKTRHEAALYVRAIACQNAASLYCYDDRERVSIVQKAESLARDLERDRFVDTPESQHPWRDWLKMAGYPMLDDAECLRGDTDDGWQD
jgi:hypothetical protein